VSFEGVPYVLARFNLRCGGGGGAFIMDGNFGESVGEDGLISSAGEVLEEPLLTSGGFLPFIWLCRLVKGGVGGLFVRAGNEFPSLGLSF
jgi:hypothetical protein